MTLPDGEPEDALGVALLGRLVALAEELATGETEALVETPLRLTDRVRDRLGVFEADAGIALTDRVGVRVVLGVEVDVVLGVLLYVGVEVLDTCTTERVVGSKLRCGVSCTLGGAVTTQHLQRSFRTSTGSGRATWMEAAHRNAPQNARKRAGKGTWIDTVERLRTHTYWSIVVCVRPWASGWAPGPAPQRGAGKSGCKSRGEGPRSQCKKPQAGPYLTGVDDSDG